MEPRAQRRKRSRPLVATFLRDPSSGRVYRRGKLIGKGAFSRCYKLTDMSTNAVFALKVVPRGGAGRLSPGGKVEREIALHSHLRHRNIVAFHGHFSDLDHVYLVLEYCSRQSLAHVLKVRRTLTEPEVRYYLRGLVSGLHYLHQRRIVHRDLKPSNFFLNKSMEVKIGDLGLATKVGPAGRCHRVLCGTPNFQAPEVVSRNGHSCKSDIWALGCIMYTVLTGTPPFTGAPLSEMYQNIRAVHYPEPTHLSPSARNLIARLLAPDPAQRPSLDHLLQDDFFTQGFTPDRLPPHSCHSPPVFIFLPPLGGLFQKVGQLLTQCRRPPCEYLSIAACPACRGHISSTCAGLSNPSLAPWTKLTMSYLWQRWMEGQELLLIKVPPNLCLPQAPSPPKRPQDPKKKQSLITQSQLMRKKKLFSTLRPTTTSSHTGPCKTAQQVTDADLKGSRGPEVEAAIKKLLLCLDAGPLVARDTPAEPKPVLWAPKCVDYSSKYGFGYQLSDGGIGVLFRDGSHMALRPPRSHVSYLPERGSLQTFAPRDVPGPLCAKLAVLRLLTCHMQRQLREEGAVPMPTVPTEPATPGFCLLSFVADSQVLVLMLSNGAVQVSSKAAQTHLVLSGDGQGLLLIHRESGGSGAALSYSVDILRQRGCVPTIHGHLRHGLRLLQSL